MSHSPQRKEKDCLNCGTIVQGKYCQECGQENIEPKETFWGMVTHFFNDITHFDGKFFVTLKDLLFKPGFLSAEYIKGRRMSYLHPIRMYVFTSAVFFLCFFAMQDTPDVFNMDNGEPLRVGQRDSLLKEAQDDLMDKPGNAKLVRKIMLLSDSTRPIYPMELIPFEAGFKAIGTIGGEYPDRHIYDSIQQGLPPGERDGWFAAMWNKKAIHLNQKYSNDPTMSNRKFVDVIFHRLPYLLFVSLPFFALILKLLYIRRKQYYYADHGVFSVHHYVLSFIILLLVFGFDKLWDFTGWAIWEYGIAGLLFAWPVYLFLEMRRFYKQGFWKTFIKFFLLNIIGLVVLLLLLIFFSVFSIFQL